MSLKFDRHDNWEDSSFITLWYSLNVCNKARMTMTRLHSVRFKCVDFLLGAAIVVVFPVSNGVHRRLRTGDCAVVQWDYLVGGVFRIFYGRQKHSKTVFREQFRISPNESIRSDRFWKVLQ